MTGLVSLHRLKGAEEVIIYETMLLNDYVQLCHINAFYYGNMYIYCQCQNNSSTQLHFALRCLLFSVLMKSVDRKKSRANEHRTGLTDFTD